MKKIFTIGALVAVGAMASHAQGLITISQTSAVIKTNTTANVTGNVSGTSAYTFEALYSSNLSLNSTNNQVLNPANLSLWTDTGVSGVNGTGLNAGKLTSAASAAATGWTVPGAVYDNQRSVIIVGFSSTYGTWANVVAAINGSGLTPGGFFGATSIGLSFAGGGAGSLPAQNLWAGITPTSLVLQQVVPTPEPTTMALAALGSAAMLLIRRRK